MTDSQQQREAAASHQELTHDFHNEGSSKSGLSQRGQHNAKFLSGDMKRILALFRDQYDPDTNPKGIVVLGVADNALMRPELVDWFNDNRLHLTPNELNYGDRLFSSTRLVNGLCRLFNDVPVGLSTEPPKLIQPVEPDHIVVGSGASGILDALFTVLCNPGEGVLLSVPWYNGFDHDLTSRAEAVIVPVYTPLPEAVDPKDKKRPHRPQQPSRAFTPDTIKYYEDALTKAKKDGIKVTSMLVCNPHNPSGLIYPTETMIASAKFAAKHQLHLVVDEIYARSVFPSPDIPEEDATKFESILSLDVEKEAGLPRSQVHLVTSASKDFGINGFRLGVYVNQGNDPVIAAMTALGILSQASAPAGALWYTWLEDDAFVTWFFKENHRRMTNTYAYVTTWTQKHEIPFVPSNAGHFLLLDLRRFLPDVKSDDSEEERRKAEAALTSKFFEQSVFVAPGAQYHHPVPGWFRLTFSLSPMAIREGLARMEKALGLEEWIGKRPALDHQKDMFPRPKSSRHEDKEAVDFMKTLQDAQERLREHMDMLREHMDMLQKLRV